MVGSSRNRRAGPVYRSHGGPPKDGRLCVVAAAYSVPAAFLNGLANGGHGVNGFITGAAMAGVVIVSLVLGPKARGCFQAADRSTGLMLTAAWLILFAVVVANSIGFTASNRVEVIGSKQAAINKAQRASDERTRLTADLQEAQHSPRWEQTSGCTANRSRGASKEYCDRIDEMRHGIQVANAALNVARPASSDEMASELSWVTGLAPATIQRLQPIWTVVAAEIAAAAAFLGAFAPAAPAATSTKTEDAPAEPQLEQPRRKPQRRKRLPPGVVKFPERKGERRMQRLQ